MSIDREKNEGIADGFDAPKKTEKILDKLNLPLSLLSGMSQMEIVGNKEVTIDGVQGVLEYGDDCIRVSTGKMVLKFVGRNLSIKGLTSQTLIITGYIISIEFI